MDRTSAKSLIFTKLLKEIPASNTFLNRSKLGPHQEFDLYNMIFRLASTFNDRLLKLTGDKQKAVNFLGMSRQFFVDLLEKGEIPHHRVGSHRRVYFKDLLDYQRERDKKRREGMNRLFHEINETGLDDPE